MKFKSYRKLILISFLVFLLASSCNTEKTTKMEKSDAIGLEMPDTILVNLDSINAIVDERSYYFSKAKNDELIDSLLAMSYHHNVTDFTEVDSLFGHYMDYGKYYKINIPRSIYLRIFPKEDIFIDRIIRPKGTRILEIDSVFYSYYGKEIKEERKYSTLYSIVEKDEYIQLVMTSSGKYAPALDLVLVRKSDFQLIDKLELNGGLVDAGDIDYWQSSFSSDFNSIEKKIIKNVEYWGNADTTIQQFKINSAGKLILERESYKRFKEH